MFEDIQQLIISHQFAVILIFAGTGSAITLVAYTHTPKPVFWRKVDLAWILLGGSSALTALIASVHLTSTNESKEIIRTVKSELSIVNRSTKISIRRNCTNQNSIPVYDYHVRIICSALNNIEIVTRKNSPVFALYSGLEQQIGGEFSFCKGSDCQHDIDFASIFEKVEDLDEDGFFNLDEYKFWGITSNDPIANSSAEILLNTGIFSDVASEYIEINVQLNELEDEFISAKLIWDEIMIRNWLLALRILSVACFSFALPFRVGKSVAEIMKA